MPTRIKINQHTYDGLRTFAYQIRSNPKWMTALHRREDLTDFLKPHLAELRQLNQALRPVADGMWELVWFAHSKEEDELTKQVGALDLVRGGDIQANLSRYFELDDIGQQLDLAFSSNRRTA
jgi:hypothetical protein